MSKVIDMFEKEFYHDGRGPELQRVIWGNSGRTLLGFEYYNPDDASGEENIKHLKLHKVEAFLMASDEVHGNIRATSRPASIFKIVDSPFLASFQKTHLKNCHHFQIMFYDEIYDVICHSITPGKGRLAPGSCTNSTLENIGATRNFDQGLSPLATNPHESLPKNIIAKLSSLFKVSIRLSIRVISNIKASLSSSLGSSNEPTTIKDA